MIVVDVTVDGVILLMISRGLVSSVGWIKKAKHVIQDRIVYGNEEAGEYIIVNRVASS